MTRHVLVVEDEQDIAKWVKLHLRDLSCEVTLALDGVVALAKAEALDFDLIILDLKLPGMDGLEVCRRLRSHGRYTQILILTSKSSELDRVLVHEMGADDYLTKAFSVMELMTRVKALFRRIDALGSGKAQGSPCSHPTSRCALRSCPVQRNMQPSTPPIARMARQRA